jgi:hypothetical protein
MTRTDLFFVNLLCTLFLSAIATLFAVAVVPELIVT